MESHKRFVLIANPYTRKKRPSKQIETPKNLGLFAAIRYLRIIQETRRYDHQAVLRLDNSPNEVKE
jgi:hypothetical protein